MAEVSKETAKGASSHFEIGDDLALLVPKRAGALGGRLHHRDPFFLVSVLLLVMAAVFSLFPLVSETEDMTAVTDGLEDDPKLPALDPPSEPPVIKIGDVVETPLIYKHQEDEASKENGDFLCFESEDPLPINAPFNMFQSFALATEEERRFRSALGSYIFWKDQSAYFPASVQAFEKNNLAGSSNDDESGWYPIGSRLSGQDGEFAFGMVTLLSDDGRRLAVMSCSEDHPNDSSHACNGGVPGHVVLRVYDWNDNDWTLAGEPIFERYECDVFDVSIAMSGDGTRIVIGNPRTNVTDGTVVLSNEQRDKVPYEMCSAPVIGRVRTLDWNGSSWQQVGSEQWGQVARDRFGTSVGLSSDGSTMIVAADAMTDEQGIKHETGVARVYKWGKNHDWIQLGSDLVRQDQDSLELSCYQYIKTAISGHGTRIAVGRTDYDGHVHTFDWDGTRWVEFGPPVDIECGVTEMSISKDGKTMLLMGDEPVVFTSSGGAWKYVDHHDYLYAVLSGDGRWIGGRRFKNVCFQVEEAM